MDDDHITTATCDGCGQKTVGVMHHNRGTPVLFLCNGPRCGANGFERVARRDIAEWVDFDWKLAEVEEIMEQ